METKTIDKGDQSTYRTMLLFGFIGGIILGINLGQFFANEEKQHIEYEKGFIEGREHQLKVMELQIKNGK